MIEFLTLADVVVESSGFYAGNTYSYQNRKRKRVENIRCCYIGLRRPWSKGQKSNKMFVQGDICPRRLLS